MNALDRLRITHGKTVSIDCGDRRVVAIFGSIPTGETLDTIQPYRDLSSSPHFDLDMSNDTRFWLGLGNTPMPPKDIAKALAEDLAALGWVVTITESGTNAKATTPPKS
jgi:hypothetical protein